MRTLEAADTDNPVIDSIEYDPDDGPISDAAFNIIAARSDFLFSVGAEPTELQIEIDERMKEAIRNGGWG